MSNLAIAKDFVECVRAAKAPDQLSAALMGACDEMGFDYFALLHHVDFVTEPDRAFRLHNYPSGWQDWFDNRGLGRSDPVHRASHRSNVGFTWSAIPGMIKMTPADEGVLENASRVGIGAGFTVPANVPGEMLGSCSFAVATGHPFPEEQVYIAQLIGGFAFEAGRRLAHGGRAPLLPTLTDRQRDCVLLAARGRTDREIARFLGISHETVIQHLKNARERYGVQKRALLAVRALFDGLISFSDVLKR
jgi:LuxR family quorum-sensing system transcriptional regulator CciR